MNGKPLLEFNGDDKLERERLYAASLDQLLAVEDFDFDGSGTPEPSETIWTLTDYQGSVNSLYVSASRFTRLHYDDFGRPVEPRGTVEYNELRNTVSVGYLGLEFDDATSLYLDGTRPYDATAGRYFTAASFVNGIFGVYAFANNTPADRTVGALSNDFSGAGIDNGSNWVRLAGVLQAGFGIVEMVGGITASVGTGGLLAVFGGLAVTANGADNFGAGLGSIWTGQSMETTLHRTVKSSATSVMSAGNAERLATGVDIAAGFGAGWADDVVRAGAKYVEAGNSIAEAGQLAARHGAKFAKVQAGGIAAGTAIGATIGGAQNGWQGALDGALLGANVGSMAGGLAANFAVSCFTAGTPLVVDMEGNSRPIDEIEVGDFVLARSEFDPDGPLELKRVEEKFVRTAVVMELVVHGQSIKTTAEHPFYVPLQGKFVAAGELQVGEQLVGHDGKLVEIESIGSTGEVTTVYNLRVADFHTYFVGGGLWGFDVWVHNATYKVAPVSEATVSLRMVDGMSSVEFAKKARALQELGDQGRLVRAANPVARDRAVTNAYRQDMIRRIWAQYGTQNREFANKLIDRVTRRMSPDHVHELQLGGADAASNLKFLDRFTNRHVGTQQIRPQLRNVPVGTTIRIKIE